METPPDHPILWHIAISHYSEKVRWALEYKSVEHERRTAPPGLHIAVALWLSRGRAFTFPIVQLDGTQIADSTVIIAALERRFPEPPLYPADPEEYRRALELEEFFDEQLGPYARRLAFHEVRQDPELLDQIVARVSPRLHAALGRALVPYSRAFTALRYGAGSPHAAEVARQKIVTAVDRIEAELGERDYLVGGRFTVADLTAAALLYPIVRPPEAPAVTDRITEPFARFRDTLCDRRGYRWVQQIFHQHRHTQPPSQLHTNELAATQAVRTGQKSAGSHQTPTWPRSNITSRRQASPRQLQKLDKHRYTRRGRLDPQPIGLRASARPESLAGLWLG
jgi:glutathione S-transferase